MDKIEGYQELSSGLKDWWVERSRNRDPDRVKKKTLLIVDDDPQITTLLSNTVDRKKYFVFKAHDALEAMDCLHRDKPDMIILDIMMPGFSGLEFLEKARKKFFQNDLPPVVILTASQKRMDLEKATSLGVAGYFLKPFNIESLLSVIDRFTR